MSEFILYSYFRSSASFRVRIALNLKGIPYEYRAVHLINNGGEQHATEYKKLNPSSQVPTLVHNGHSIAQSVGILDYLDHVKPTPALFPNDPYQRALVFQACEIINSGIQPLHNLGVLKKLAEKYGANDEQKNEWTSGFIREGIEVLEAFLKPIAGKFSVGNEVTAADCFVIPQLGNADRFKVSLENFPTLRRIRENCDLLDAFRKAGPRVQPDTPADFTG